MKLVASERKIHMNLNDQVCNDKTLIMEHTISDLKIRLKKWYPDEINAFENAKSDEEIIDLQKKFVSQAKEKLILELQKTNTDSKILSALRSTDETLAAIITEQLYQTLCNARNEQIQTELVKLFDEVERLKNMGSQDIEVLTYAMINGGLVALGIGMATDLILNLLAGLGLGEAIFTALTTLGMSGFGIVVDIVILAIIPIFYFMAKPAACIFVVINDLDTDLVIDSEKVIHGKINVKTTRIPAAYKIKNIVRSGGIWSTQKKDAALYGSEYAVVLKQEKSSSGSEPDDTKFAIGVECPLASGNNSCAVGINKTVDQIGKEVDDYRRQEVFDDNGTYKMEMRCHSAHGSIAYYVCRIYKNKRM